jgi:hypothetical protein
MPKAEEDPKSEQTPATKPNRPAKLWCVVRMVDYRMQGLSPEDPEDKTGEQEWCEIGGETTISSDREAMFQLARRHQGLLMSVDGMPPVSKVRAFLDSAKAVREVQV